MQLKDIINRRFTIRNYCRKRDIENLSGYVNTISDEDLLFMINSNMLGTWSMQVFLVSILLNFLSNKENSIFKLFREIDENSTIFEWIKSEFFSRNFNSLNDLNIPKLTNNLLYRLDKYTNTSQMVELLYNFDADNINISADCTYMDMHKMIVEYNGMKYLFSCAPTDTIILEDILNKTEYDYYIFDSYYTCSYLKEKYQGKNIIYPNFYFTNVLWKSEMEKNYSRKKYYIFNDYQTNEYITVLERKTEKKLQDYQIRRSLSDYKFTDNGRNRCQEIYYEYTDNSYLSDIMNLMRISKKLIIDNGKYAKSLVFKEIEFIKDFIRVYTNIDGDKVIYDCSNADYINFNKILMPPSSIKDMFDSFMNKSEVLNKDQILYNFNNNKVFPR